MAEPLTEARWLEMHKEINRALDYPSVGSGTPEVTLRSRTVVDIMDQWAATRLALAASQATARAAREALDEVEDCEALDDAHAIATVALAAPADESALRAVCERVAAQAFVHVAEHRVSHPYNSADVAIVVSRVLGPSGKETTHG